MKYRVAAFIVTLGIASAGSAETLLERGEYLVEGPVACGNCHTSPVPGSAPYAGNILQEVDWAANVQNITPAGRVGSWTDEELARAIRECIRPDGTVIGPPMPCGLYRNISDTDLSAIVAYIRTLAPAESDHVVSTEYPFPVPPNYGPPITTVAEIPRGPTAEYGAYLVGPLAHCSECHSLTKQGPDFENNYGGGGYEWHGPWGISVAANITNGEDGLAGYSDDEIKTMITQGKRPDGSAMFPPMGYAYYSNISDEDLTAIVAYLRTIPPLPGN